MGRKDYSNKAWCSVGNAVLTKHVAQCCETPGTWNSSYCLFKKQQSPLQRLNSTKLKQLDPLLTSSLPISYFLFFHRLSSESLELCNRNIKIGMDKFSMGICVCESIRGNSRAKVRRMACIDNQGHN